MSIAKTMHRASYKITGDSLEATVSYLIERRVNAPWMVFLHGLQTAAAVFIPMMEHPAFKNYSVLAIDFLGFGESDASPANFSFDLKAQASVVSQVLAHERIEKFNIVGHSMGGMIAIILAASQPGVSAVANLEGNLRDADSGASKDIEAMACGRFLTSNFPQLLEALRTSNTESDKVRYQFLKAANPLSIYASAKSIATYARTGEIFEMFKNLKHRKCLVRGGRSKFLPLPKDSSIKEYVIPGGSHFMFIDEPEVTISAIADFFCG